jgi:hypothetical protein
MMKLLYALLKNKKENWKGFEGFGGEVIHLYCMVYGENIFARFL